MQLLAERLKLRGFHVGLVAHDEATWEFEADVHLVGVWHSILVQQFQHNRYFRKLPSESLQVADDFATEWAEKREAAAA